MVDNYLIQLDVMEDDLDLDPNEEAETHEMEKKLNKAKNKILWRKRVFDLLDEY